MCGTGIHRGAAGGISQLDGIGKLGRLGGCGHGGLGRRSAQQWAVGRDTCDADQRHGEWHVRSLDGMLTEDDNDTACPRPDSRGVVATLWRLTEPYDGPHHRGL